MTDLNSHNHPKHGDKVLYHGYEEGTIPAIQQATIIGWDEDTFYTEIRKFIPKPHTRTQHPQWSNEFHLYNVDRDIMLGFHRSRLIKIIPEFKPIESAQLIQKELF